MHFVHTVCVLQTISFRGLRFRAPCWPASVEGLSAGGVPLSTAYLAKALYFVHDNQSVLLFRCERILGPGSVFCV